MLGGDWGLTAETTLAGLVGVTLPVNQNGVSSNLSKVDPLAARGALETARVSHVILGARWPTFYAEMPTQLSLPQGLYVAWFTCQYPVKGCAQQLMGL